MDPTPAFLGLKSSIPCSTDFYIVLQNFEKRKPLPESLAIMTNTNYQGNVDYKYIQGLN